MQIALCSKGTGSRFPQNDEFRAAFMIKDVYNYPRRNYLLRRLESYHRKEQILVESCTIEHIMPQNARLSEIWQQELGEDWKETHTRYLHTIGNLTLTGYNSQLSDRPFYEKKTIEGGFDQSPLRLNISLKTVKHWNQQAIEKRAQDLADDAINIWSIPTLPLEKTIRHTSKQAKITPLNEKKIYALNDYAYLQGEMFTLFSELRKRILNLSVHASEEFRKHYIAYKLTSNFVGAETQKNSLLITMSIPFEEIDDPKGLGENITHVGHRGPGQVRVRLSKMNQLDDAMYLIQQAFDRQNSDVVLA